MSDCLFCKIVDGEVPADVVHRNEHAVAFRDIVPQAPTHVLVIPTTHVPSFAECGDDALACELWNAVREVARGEGLEGQGYRVVTNVGADGGQTVPHLHFHVLGGRPLTWPPG